MDNSILVKVFDCKKELAEEKLGFWFAELALVNDAVKQLATTRTKAP
jgi:hypothetical protein